MTTTELNLHKPGSAAKALGCLLLLATAVFAGADVERDLVEKTGHRYVSNVGESTIDDLVAQGYRMFDIEVLSTGPHRYAASFVKNTGGFATGWWWTANKKKADLVDFYTSRGARIIDLEAYTVDGVRRYAATTVENRGRDQKEWWWFDGASWQEMLDIAAQHGARITDLDVEVVKSKRSYSGVMIKNSGADHKNWTVFSNITSSEIKSLMSERRMRLVDLERISDTKFAGILEESAGQHWWWFTNQDWESAQRLVGQYGSRVIDLERRVVNGSSRFDLILLDNNNDLEWRIGEMLRKGSDGTRGFILKEVNGPTLGTILPNFRTYAASTIKVLEHYYWSRQIGNGLSPLTLVPIYSNSTSDTHTKKQVIANQTLQLTMQNMMLPSSNVDANALQDFAGGGNGVTGRLNIKNFSEAVLGLDPDDIQIHHKLGDGNVANDPYNILTMNQIAALYQDFANSVGLTPIGWNFFHDNMLNEAGVGGTAFRNGVRTIMQQEGALLGMTNNESNAVFNQVVLCWKAGNVPNYQSAAGWIRLPYNTPNGVVLREFCVAMFQDAFTNSTLGSTSGVILPEILRDEIAKVMLTWQ